MSEVLRILRLFCCLFIFGLVGCHSSPTWESVYFDAGSLGKSSWEPSDEDILAALSLSEQYCRSNLSDQQREKNQVDSDISIEISFKSNDGDKFRPDASRDITRRKSNDKEESFTISGLPYHEYKREIRSFVQPRGYKRYEIIAVQHIPSPSKAIKKFKGAPFTLYYNVTSGRIGRRLGIPAISFSSGFENWPDPPREVTEQQARIYSPGPPYSFHRKSAPVSARQ